MKEFSVSDFLEDITIHTQAACFAKNITFQVEKTELLEHFYGDRTLIFRALMNIIYNACDKSPGNSTIMLLAQQKDELIIFRVTDSGSGFSSEELKQAVEPFYTGQKERSGKHYGLGLFLAKSAAEKHGGTLTLANNESTGGAVVTITLQNGNRTEPYS